MRVSDCPNCGGNNLFTSKAVSAGGGHAPNYLPGLGRFLRTEKFVVVLCKDCGLTRFFARPEATARLPESSKWSRVR